VTAFTDEHYFIPEFNVYICYGTSLTAAIDELTCHILYV